MTIIRCPRCRDEVTAPAKASRLAIVRCPLCLEEYPLADALKHAPPELIVVGGAAEVSPASAERDAVAAAPDYQVSGGAGVFDAGPGAGAAMPAMPVTKAARPRRRQGSGIGTLIGIVLGGVAGISLAVLLLWWVFDRDPMNFAPEVAKIDYIKWIVPSKYHPPQKSGDQPASSTADGKPVMPAPKPRPGAPTPTSGSGGLQTFPEPGAFAGPDNANQVTPAAGVGPELPPELPKPAGNLDLSALDPSAPLNPTPATSPAGTLGPREDSRPKGTEKPLPPDLTNLLPANTPPAPAVTAPAPPTADDFKQAVLTAGDALARYDASGGEGTEARQAKFTEMYVAIAEMGRAITFLSLNDSDIEGMVKEMQLLLNKLAGIGGPNKLSGVRFLAATHWTERKHGEGLLVAGHVKNFKAVGPLFEVTLDATTRGNAISIPVICDKNPQDFCQLEDELVVVGRIIDDPKSNLPGYEGTHPRVLMLGYCVKAPRAP